MEATAVVLRDTEAGAAPSWSWFGSVRGLDIRARVWCINTAVDGSFQLLSPWFTARW
jgi:hypothetical protein